jgi:hypothetical protein
MADYLKTALLLEEKAAKLPRDNPQRTHLLGLAKATRQVAFEQAAAERKQGTIDAILLLHDDVTREDAEFLYEIAVRFGRRGFLVDEISDTLGGDRQAIERKVRELRGKGTLIAAIGEDDTMFGLDVLYRWIIDRVEA